MHKLFVDLNIVLDVLLAREPHLMSSQKLLNLIVKNKARGYMSASSIMNLYYIVDKALAHKEALGHIEKLFKLFHIVEINKDILERGVQIHLADYEDSVQVACAENCRADYIITRNLKDFKESPIPSISPDRYLESHY